MGQGWDSGEEPAISEPSTDAAKEAFLSSEVRPRDETKHTKEDLEASRVRLEAAGVNIAIWDDGSMRIVVSEPERTKAIDAGGTIYSPEDMLHYVELDQRERRLLHQFRKHFGGIVEWPPRASAQPKTLWPFKPHGRATTI